MPRCLQCGNTKRFRTTSSQYCIVIVSFDPDGNVTNRNVEYAEPGGEDTWPWICDACESDNVEMPSDVGVT